MNDAKQDRRELLALIATLGVAAAGATGARAQSAAGKRSPGVKVVFENDVVRVVEHVQRPRMGVCGTGLHSHPPHVTIVLTDTKVKVTLPGKEPFVAEDKAPKAFWDPGGSHMVENVGSRASRVLLIERKLA